MRAGNHGARISLSQVYLVFSLLIRLPDTAGVKGECHENSPALQRWEPHGSQKAKSRRDERTLLPSLPGLFPIFRTFPQR